MKVLVTGATGFFGTHLTRHLNEAGHSVSVVSRREGVGYDWSEESLKRAVQETDAVVHLAGENLFARRWSAKQKESIRASRVESTARLAQLLADKGDGVLLHASAVGFYGPRDAREAMDEAAPAGTDFLAGVCSAWEAAAEPARAAGIRVVSVRIGVILGADGGALKRMLLPFRLGLGGPVGNGRQAFPWIHVDDLARLFVFLLESDSAAGAFNGVAPNGSGSDTSDAGLTSAQFGRALGRALHRPAFLPLPGFALRILLGEVADVLLTGQRAIPTRALGAGFHFEHPGIEEALRDLLA